MNLLVINDRVEQENYYFLLKDKDDAESAIYDWIDSHKWDFDFSVDPYRKQETISAFASIYGEQVEWSVVTVQYYETCVPGAK